MVSLERNKRKRTRVLLTGFGMTLVFASGVNEGIQKLGNCLALSSLLGPGSESPAMHRTGHYVRPTVLQAQGGEWGRKVEQR